MFFEMRFDLGTLDSGERSLPFGLLVSRMFLLAKFSTSSLCACEQLGAPHRKTLKTWNVYDFLKNRNFRQLTIDSAVYILFFVL